MSPGRSQHLDPAIEHLLAQGQPWRRLGGVALTGLIEDLVPHTAGQTGLARYLLGTEAFAHDADPRMPRHAQELLFALREQGHSVAVLACAACGKERVVRPVGSGELRCASCRTALYDRNRDPSARRGPELDRAVAHLIDQGEPWHGLGSDALLNLIMQVAPKPNGQKSLTDYVLASRSIAHSCDPGMPRVAQQLLLELRQRGLDVLLLSCGSCGRQRLVSRSQTGGLRCVQCAQAQKYLAAKPMVTVGASQHLERAIAHLLAQGDPWQELGAADLTDTILTVAPSANAQTRLSLYVLSTDALARSADPDMPRPAQELLLSLRRRGVPVAVLSCASCGKERVVGRNREGRRLCASCVKHRVCDGCGAVRRTTDNESGKTFCRMCDGRVERRKAVCAYCGHDRDIGRQTKRGPQCQRCIRRKGACADCGEVRLLNQRRWGSVCDRCDKRVRRGDLECPGCHRSGLVASLCPDGVVRCARCAGDDSVARCVVCREEDARKHRRCWECNAVDALTRLYAGGTPSRQVLLADARMRLLTHARPQSVEQWARHSKAANLLRMMLREEMDVSHEALDAAADTGSAARMLRLVLVDVGVLEARDDRSVAFDRWLDEFLQQDELEASRELRAYCRWDVVPRLRLAIARNGVSEGTFMRARTSCRVARDFLAHLAAVGVTLRDASQSHAEDFLTARRSADEPLRMFLRWARQAGRAERLKPPPARTALPTTRYSHAELQQWIRRFLDDGSLPLRVRICGLICGLTGRPTTAIARLRRFQVVETPKGMTLLLGKSPVLLREPVAVLIRQQLQAPRFWSTAAATGSDWLFPSVEHAGEHINPKSFRHFFAEIGCSLIALRGAAIVNLIASLPLSTISDVTGSSISQTAKWQKHSGVAYASYPALRQSQRAGG